ncbi:hypothetical protein BTVI_41252 [Pitangus sulphuratus]|nr:hypothetical protein BTVI_41252 [Pitangus sulphuratus]
MPASSKIDLPVAKAKPISDAGSTFGITYLGRRERNPEQLQPERGERICERNNFTGIKASIRNLQIRFYDQKRGSIVKLQY